MQNIQSRHKALIQIISQETIYSQEELQEKLRKQGIITTQATLSRDLKALKISKVPGEGYVVPARGRAMSADFSTGILRILFSGNLAVIRTRPGLANAVAIVIDSQLVFPVLGTIAGDDTILLILREGSTVNEVLDALTPVFPEIKNRYVQ